MASLEASSWVIAMSEDLRRAECSNVSFMGEIWSWRSTVSEQGCVERLNFLSR